MLDFVKYKMLIYNRKDKICFIEEASFKPKCRRDYTLIGAKAQRKFLQIFKSMEVKLEIDNANNTPKWLSHFGVLLFSAYLPVQKNPRCARIWNLPVDVQIIQRAGVRVADMLVNPTFVQFTEVGFREDGAALGLVHGGAEQVFHIMHRHDYWRTGRVKGAEQILAAAAHGALTVAALDVDGVAPVAPGGAQELAEMRIGGSKTGNGQKITPISNCAQRNNSAQFL